MGGRQVTRDEAVQIQIDECLDNLNAEECAKVCEFLWQRGHQHWPEEWHSPDGDFCPAAIRKSARGLLKSLAARKGKGMTLMRSSWSYLFATKSEGPDEDGKNFVLLELLFRVSSFNLHDGTSYEHAKH
jgi:hypothetical protein